MTTYFLFHKNILGFNKLKLSDLIDYVYISVSTYYFSEIIIDVMLIALLLLYWELNPFAINILFFQDSSNLLLLYKPLAQCLARKDLSKLRRCMKNDFFFNLLWNLAKFFSLDLLVLWNVGIVKWDNPSIHCPIYLKERLFSI